MGQRRNGPPRFGTDGIRGVANSELTPEIAVALGRAAARHLQGSAFLLGRDSRRSGPMLQAALAAGIASEGRDVIDVGMIPTPGLAWLAGEQRRPAAMISASHNPYEDNGIKLFSPGGTKLPLQVELAIHDELDRLFGTSAGEEMGGEAGSSGEIGADPEQLTAYAARLLAIVDSPGQSGAGKSSPAGSLGGEVVIDCANGAASVLVPLIFEQL
ncbi:MAG: hypothetical protein ACRDZ5_08585, partial [Acidimicrobiales bacterium]